MNTMGKSNYCRHNTSYYPLSYNHYTTKTGEPNPLASLHPTLVQTMLNWSQRLDDAKCAQESPNIAICRNNAFNAFVNYHMQGNLIIHNQWKILITIIINLTTMNGKEIRQHHRAMPTWLYNSILLLVYEPSKCRNHANLNIILYCSSPSPPPTNKFSNSDMFHPNQLMQSGRLKLAPHCCTGRNIFDQCGSDYNSSNNQADSFREH